MPELVRIRNLHRSRAVGDQHKESTVKHSSGGRPVTQAYQGSQHLHHSYTSLWKGIVLPLPWDFVPPEPSSLCRSPREKNCGQCPKRRAASPAFLLLRSLERMDLCPGESPPQPSHPDQGLFCSHPDTAGLRTLPPFLPVRQPRLTPPRLGVSGVARSQRTPTRVRHNKPPTPGTR